MSAKPQPAEVRHDARALARFAHALFVRAGMRDDIARDVADVLVDGDLLGHTTHGLALAAQYLAELEKGSMKPSGEWTVVSETPAAQAWDGGRLPGPWLVLRALDAAMSMASSQGTGTVVIRRSHHIACLASYLKRATDRGMMAIVQSSDPVAASVAPFGAVSPVFTPNPLAAGIPTTGDPILLDVSSSYTTNGMTARLHQAGKKLPHAWIQDAQGNATDDPRVLFEEPKGTLLPTGGLEAGHKGYALALLVEAATGALAGHGRADASEGWGATVFVQVLDPAAFGGVEDFERQIDFVAAACRGATPRPGGEAVRLPGERGLRRYREQKEKGVELFEGIMASLAPWSAKLGVAVPKEMR